MKLNIEQLKSEFESELNTKNWFKNIGNHSLDTDKKFAPFCAKFTKFEQLLKLLKSNKWSDIDLDIFAEICPFSDQILRQYSLMDEIAVAAREIYRLKKIVLFKISGRAACRLNPMTIRCFRLFCVHFKDTTYVKFVRIFALISIQIC